MLLSPTLARRAHELHRHAVLEGLDLGQEALADERLAGRLDPVLAEGALQRVHDRPLDAEVRVAPVVGTVGVALPLGGDADATGEADAAVDDDHAPVAAVVGAAQQVRLRRPEADDLGSRPRASALIALGSIFAEPIASSRTRHSTPALARSQTASASSSAISPCQ